MKIYSLDQNELQKSGQAAVSSFLNSAYANDVITKDQYTELQKYAVLCHTSHGFIDRMKSFMGFQEAEDGFDNIIWSTHKFPQRLVEDLHKS